jgi:hypothetical protein
MALPEEETIEMQYFPEKEYDAAARYQGNYRTRIEMNLAATAAWFPRLFDHKVCHEGYPGHHTDYVLKEQHLARRGYTEQTLYLTLAPQCVISEGIAMVAHEMLFFLCCFFETSSVRATRRTDVWERPKTGATQVTGTRPSGSLSSFLNRTMDAITIGGKRLACSRMTCPMLFLS